METTEKVPEVVSRNLAAEMCELAKGGNIDNELRFFLEGIRSEARLGKFSTVLICAKSSAFAEQLRALGFDVDLFQDGQFMVEYMVSWAKKA